MRSRVRIDGSSRGADSGAVEPRRQPRLTGKPALTSCPAPEAPGSLYRRPESLARYRCVSMTTYYPLPIRRVHRAAACERVTSSQKIPPDDEVDQIHVQQHGRPLAVVDEPSRISDPGGSLMRNRKRRCARQTLPAVRTATDHRKRIGLRPSLRMTTEVTADVSWPLRPTLETLEIRE